MRQVSHDKYTLRDLHREIELIDRKLTHTLNHETFETEALRAAAAKKLATKRGQIMTQIQSLADLGIELPEPTPPTDSAASRAEAAEVSHSEVVESTSEFGEKVSRLERENSIATSPLAAWQDDLEAYKRRRGKATAA